MNKTKKAVCMALAGTMLAGCLAGCSGKNGGDVGADGKVNLLIGLPGGDGVTAIRVVDDFIAKTADKYNIETDESSWGDFTQKVKLQMASKNDVIPVFVTDSANAASFGAQGALEDLSARVEADIDASLYTKALTSVKDTEGHLWGVPHGINSIAMLYNKDVFDEKGIAYPTEDWTWQDMMDLAEKLTFDRDGDGKTDVYGIYYSTNITQGWLPFMAAYGTLPLKDNFRNSNLDDPKVKEALGKYQSNKINGYMMESAEISAIGNAPVAFTEGKIAMMLAQASQLGSINNFKADMNYDAQIMPIGWNGERTCIYVPNVWVMYKGASDAVKGASWEFLKHYLSEESQMILANEAPAGYPVMKKALDAVSNNGVKPEGKDAFYRGIDDYGMTIMENPCSTQVNNVVNAVCAKLMNKENLDDLIGPAHEELQDELNYYYENM